MLFPTGETQAEWFAEGLLERLTDPHDAVSRHLLRDAVLYVCPNVCLDGTWRCGGKNMLTELQCHKHFVEFDLMYVINAIQSKYQLTSELICCPNVHLDCFEGVAPVWKHWYIINVSPDVVATGPFLCTIYVSNLAHLHIYMLTLYLIHQ